MIDDHDERYAHLEIPAFLRLTERARKDGWTIKMHWETPAGEAAPVVPSDAVRAAYLAAQEEERRIKARNRIARMLDKKAGKEAIAAGKHWNINTGKWE